MSERRILWSRNSILWVEIIFKGVKKSCFKPWLLGRCSNDLPYFSDLDLWTKDSRGHLSFILDSSKCHFFFFYHKSSFLVVSILCLHKSDLTREKRFPYVPHKITGLKFGITSQITIRGSCAHSNVLEKRALYPDQSHRQDSLVPPQSSTTSSLSMWIRFTSLQYSRL